MQYINAQSFSHDQSEKTALLIVNLGTPAAPTPKALRRYLKTFLWDPRVVELPRPLWWLILNGVILSIRPFRSAKAYQKVWTERGSPLLLHTEDQSKALEAALTSETSAFDIVAYAMRYGDPSIEEVIDGLRKQHVTRLLVLPLYPQYSATTTASVFDAVSDAMSRHRWLPELRFINQYHDTDAYIHACAEQIRRYRAEHGSSDILMFSFHGIPKRYLMNGDPYHCQCLKSARLIAEALQLNSTEYMTCFQSRFGREEWLKPYTDHSLEALAKSGTASVQVFCPGFASDCLETIEEIGMENRDVFLQAGGKRYDYIP
ncbi:ferrochelatase, partial [bacterium]|nr:ferrochelatase [bacterium]